MLTFIDLEYILVKLYFKISALFLFESKHCFIGKSFNFFFFLHKASFLNIFPNYNFSQTFN
jgi:hypothetical protein